jgi:hypothetical protein
VNYSDLANSGIELVGAAVTLTNVVALHRDKMVRGISLLPVVFFTLWGAWNIFFYHTNGLFYSALAGVAMFLVNALWLVMAVYYERDRLRAGISKMFIRLT